MSVSTSSVANKTSLEKHLRGKKQEKLFHFVRSTATLPFSQMCLWPDLKNDHILLRERICHALTWSFDYMQALMGQIKEKQSFTLTKLMGL